MIKAMSAIPKTLLTEDEYLAKERAAETRSEFYRGEMFAMSGASLAHVDICGNLNFELKGRLRGTPCRVFAHDLKVRINASGLYTYPDLIVACGELELRDSHTDVLLNPQIIIEVLSKSTEAYDRGTKFSHYQKIPTLREYVLISQHTAAIDRFERSSDGKWSLTPVSGMDSVLAFQSIPVELRLADIYRDVTFDSAESNDPPKQQIDRQ